MPDNLDQRARWIARHILPHEPSLRAWLGRRPAFRHEVDDIVQETYAVLASLDSVAHIRAPKAYMYQTARSVMLRHVRRARIVTIEALSELDQLGLADDQPSPELKAADRQELRRVAQLVADLPAKCAQALTLRKFQGLSQRDAAQRMGVSESTIEKHVAKGVRLLMDAMGRGGSSAPGASREEDTPIQDPNGARRDER